MFTVILRTIVMYFTLLLTIRLMGKRQAGQLEISELAVTFMLSELAVVPISDENVPFLRAIVPILILLSFEIILSFIISRSSSLKKFLIGRPSVIIRRGKLDQKELTSLRMSLSELMGEMRLKGISSISEVEYAIIEDNGQLSVFKKEAFSPATNESLKGCFTEKGIAHCVIVEGKIFKENLALSGKDESWIRRELKKRKLSEDDVFLMTVDDSGDIYIILKEKTKSTP